MPVVATTLATGEKSKGSEHPLLAQVLRAVLPMSSPELGALFPDVRRWWVEVDDDGVPQREVGFNATGQAIVAGPLDNDMGFWTDSPMRFLPNEHEAVDQRAFDSAWNEFVIQWSVSHAGRHA